MPPVTRFCLEEEVYDPLTCVASPQVKMLTQDGTVEAEASSFKTELVLHLKFSTCMEATNQALSPRCTQKCRFLSQEVRENCRAFVAPPRAFPLSL